MHARGPWTDPEHAEWSLLRWSIHICRSPDPCCNSQDPCCGNPDPCCNPDNPCCGNPGLCCNVFGQLGLQEPGILAAASDCCTEYGSCMRDAAQHFDECMKIGRSGCGVICCSNPNAEACRNIICLGLCDILVQLDCQTARVVDERTCANAHSACVGLDPPTQSSKDRERE